MEVIWSIQKRSLEKKSSANKTLIVQLQIYLLPARVIVSAREVYKIAWYHSCGGREMMLCLNFISKDCKKFLKKKMEKMVKKGLYIFHSKVYALQGNASTSLRNWSILGSSPKTERMKFSHYLWMPVQLYYREHRTKLLGPIHLEL